MAALRGAEAPRGMLMELQSADPTVRWRAAAGLAKVRTVESAEALAAALNDPEPFVRWFAAQALAEVARMATDRTLLALVSRMVLEAAAADDAGARAAAADVIAAWGPRGPLEPAMALLQDGEAPVRAAAVRALGLAGGEALQVVVPSLLRALEDQDAEVRRMAADALAWSRDGVASSALNVLLGDPSAIVRAAALRALAKLGDGALEAAALALLRDADPAVRLEAIRSLRLHGSARALAPLAAAENDETSVLDVTVGALAREARFDVSRRVNSWRSRFLRWRARHG